MPADICILLSSNFKVYGISDLMEENKTTVEKNLKACEKSFTDTFTIENTNVKYHYIHPPVNRVLAQQRVQRENAKNKKQPNLHDTYRRPVLALTNA